MSRVSAAEVASNDITFLQSYSRSPLLLFLLQYLACLVGYANVYSALQGDGLNDTCSGYVLEAISMDATILHMAMWALWRLDFKHALLMVTSLKIVVLRLLMNI